MSFITMEFTPLLLLTSVLVILLVFFHVKRKKQGNVSVPPGPLALPFIGNLHQLESSKPYEYFRLLSQKYGPLMLLKLGSKPLLLVSSSRVAEQVMKIQDQVFCNRSKLLGTQKLTYHGLDIAMADYSESWRQMKKIAIIHLFTTKRVKLFRPVREDEVSGMIKKIYKAASLSKTINIDETIMSLTNTITGRIAFGKRYDEEDQKRGSFFALIKETQTVITSFYFSDYFPIIGWALDKITGAITRLENNFNSLDLVIQEAIDNHLDTNRPKSTEDDVIDILLQLREDKSTPIDLTIDHIKAFLMDMFFGGTETTAATIVWAMTSLIQSPSTMKKVQEEIRNVTGKKEMVDEDDCQKLPYLKAVIKETLRLYPPFPLLLPRESIDKCIIDGYKIEAKTMVYVNAWAIGRDPEVWEKPDEFMPERFLNSNIDVKGQDFMLIPFGAGRRICPGISMALAIVELVLANLLYSFDWSLPCGMKEEDINTDVLPGLIMHKKDTLFLHANIIN